MQYEHAYKVLFNASINALAMLDQMTEKTPKIIRVEMTLMKAQQTTENLYRERVRGDFYGLYYRKF